MFSNAASDAIEELCGEAFMRFCQFEVKCDNESGGDATYRQVWHDYKGYSQKDNIIVQKIEDDDLFVGFDVSCGDEGGQRRIYAWGHADATAGAVIEDLMLEFEGSRWMFFNAEKGTFAKPE